MCPVTGLLVLTHPAGGIVARLPRVGVCGVVSVWVWVIVWV
ncbi:hypothetical protein E2C01_080412 [Portunus trituberculatus]|uniref:Uncharacterized protein n=1 Tax=Portunus trituberculatus TaxID=210409 RepID=A0A5B7IM60_PORTR|nr:hypothetical protein [Portunus trituberculatus]